MSKYKAVIEYTPSDKLDEDAMLEAEHAAFNKAIPSIRGKKFDSLEVSTSYQRLSNYADLSAATCIIYLNEAK